MGELGFVPHLPLHRFYGEIPKQWVIRRNQIYDVTPRDYLRIIQITKELTNAVDELRPDVIPIFAAGAVPINFGIIYRLWRERKYELFDPEKKFHLFPGLLWELDGKKGEKIFIDFLDEYLKSLDGKKCKIFITDTTFSGGGINNLINVFEKSCCDNFDLQIHAIVDISKERTGAELIGTFESVNVKVVIPDILKAGKDKLLDGYGSRFKENGTIFVKYYPVHELFTEDKYQWLGAIALRPSYSELPVEEFNGDIYLRLSDDYFMPFSGGGNSIASSFINALAGLNTFNLDYLEKAKSFTEEEIELIKKNSHGDVMIELVRLDHGDFVETEKSLLDKKELLKEAELYWIFTRSAEPKFLGKVLAALEENDEPEILANFVAWFTRMFKQKFFSVDVIEKYKDVIIICLEKAGLKMNE